MDSWHKEKGKIGYLNIEDHSRCYDMNARFYVADLRRFKQHDPLSSSTFDPYGYNNPIFFADPTGLEG